MVWPEGNPVCLDVPGGNIQNGQPLQIWGCNGLSQQSWTFDNWQIKLRDANKCVDIPGGEFHTGNVLQLWDCNGMPGQQWGYDTESRSIYAAGSADATLCFDVAGGSDDFGASVWVWNCDHDLLQQQWYVPPNFGTYNIQSLMEGSFLCLDLLGQYTFNGNAIGAWDCNGFEGQSWIFDAGTWNIRWAKDTSKCVDVPGGQFHSGVELWIWDCNGQDSQMFGYDPDEQTIYAAASDASMCIDVPKDLSTGAKVWLWDCNGQSQQQWKVPSGELWRGAEKPSTV